MRAILLITMALIVCYSTKADIENGYQDELQVAEQSLKNLEELIKKLTPQNSDEQFYKLKSHYLRAKRTYKHLSAYYSKTEELITLLLTKDPAFYSSIKSVRNFHGQVTHVYIRVMPVNRMRPGIFGSTNLEQTINDPHVYQSRYGLNTVSVHIRECSPSKQLELLVHELAHVKYQVPNLASYMEYFKQSYLGFKEYGAYGHLKDDPSNQSVANEMIAFRAKVYGKEKLSKGEVLALGHGSEVIGRNKK